MSETPAPRNPGSTRDPPPRPAKVTAPPPPRAPVSDPVTRTAAAQKGGSALPTLTTGAAESGPPFPRSACPRPGLSRTWFLPSRKYWDSVVMGGHHSGPVQPRLVSLTRLQAPWGFLDFDSKACLCSRVEAGGSLWGPCGGQVSQ